MARQNKGISVTVDNMLQNAAYDNVVAIPFMAGVAVWEPCIILKKGAVLGHNMQNFIGFFFALKRTA